MGGGPIITCCLGVPKPLSYGPDRLPQTAYQHGSIIVLLYNTVNKCEASVQHISNAWK